MNIVITLDPQLLDNPDADLRYILPDYIQEKTEGALKDDGYDYGEGDVMQIFMSVRDGIEDPVSIAKTAISGIELLGNRIDRAVQIRMAQ